MTNIQSIKNIMIKCLYANILFLNVLILINAEIITTSNNNTYTSKFHTQYDNNQYTNNFVKILLPFNIVYQGNYYTTLYLFSDSLISFGNQDLNMAYYEYSLYPKILISSRYILQTNLLILFNSSICLIFFKGCQYDYQYNWFNLRKCIKWRITFYAKDYQYFDVSILQNTFDTAGLISLCSNLNCYQYIQPKNYTIIQCKPNQCYNGTECIATALINCETCDPSGTTCKQCIRNYTMNNNNCSSCNQNFTLFNEKCIQYGYRCKTFSRTNPAICQVCKFNLKGDYCNTCINFDQYQFITTNAQTVCIRIPTPTIDFSIGLMIAAIAGGILLLISIIFLTIYLIKRSQRLRMELQRQNRNEQNQNQSTEQNFIGQQCIISNQSCSICLQLSNNIKTECGHYFHRKCLKSWRVKSALCPNCKNEIQMIYRGCKYCKNYNIKTKQLKFDKELESCEQCKTKNQQKLKNVQNKNSDIMEVHE